MENEYYGFVYETTNLINQKKYIGKCIFSRKNNWKSYMGSGLYLKKDIKKFGLENFKREILLLAYDDKELNELEEFMIKSSNAVTSENYYNVKDNAIGGDVFTNNPRKEEIRISKKLQMSGSRNHQFGKDKTEKMINSVKLANSKKIIVNGIKYDSLNECSKVLKIGNTTISYRLRNPKNKNYEYCND